jgi:hypothetical protein
MPEREPPAQGERLLSAEVPLFMPNGTLAARGGAGTSWRDMEF